MDLTKRLLEMEGEMKERIEHLSDVEKIHLADLILMLTRCYGPEPNSAVVLSIHNGKLAILSLNNTELEAHTLCRDASSILADSLGANIQSKDVH